MWICIAHHRKHASKGPFTPEWIQKCIRIQLCGYIFVSGYIFVKMLILCVYT